MIYPTETADTILRAHQKPNTGLCVLLQDGYALPYSAWGNDTVMGRKLLTDSHEQLMAYHASEGINLPAAVQDAYPTQAIVALWDQSVAWSGGAWHSGVRAPLPRHETQL